MRFFRSWGDGFRRRHSCCDLDRLRRPSDEISHVFESDLPRRSSLGDLAHDDGKRFDQVLSRGDRRCHRQSQLVDGGGRGSYRLDRGALELPHSEAVRGGSAGHGA
jgi:hypothetical protein